LIVPGLLQHPCRFLRFRMLKSKFGVVSANVLIVSSSNVRSVKAKSSLAPRPLDGSLRTDALVSSAAGGGSGIHG
jgi:hypothetical protein